MAYPFISGRFQGPPLGTLSTYAAGTLTPLATYTTAALSVANPTAINLDANGQANVWLGSAAYRMRCFDSAGALQWDVDNIGASDSIAQDLASSASAVKGAGMVAFNSAKAYAAGTVGEHLRRVRFFEDGGALGDDSNDDTAEIQAVIDAVAALGGGAVLGVAGKTYKITAALTLKSNVMIDLMGSKIKQYATNTPILTAPGTDIQGWSVRNGRLEYSAQQTSANTSAIGIRLAVGANSYLWAIDDLVIAKACDGIGSPNASGTFAFVGRINNVTCADCAAWAQNIDCDTATGANTNIVITNCWALQTAGSEIATSKGFRYKGLSMGQWNSLFADHIQGQFVAMESCSGRVGVMTLESADIVVTAPTELVTLADSPVKIDTLKFVSNTFTVTGAGEIYMLRATSSGALYRVDVSRFVTTGNAYSGAAIYEVNPSAFIEVHNDYASLDRAVSLVDSGIHKRIKQWAGVDRSVALNTTANRPTVAANGIGNGAMYFDTTLGAAGKPIWHKGGNAWVDATGAVV